MRIKLFAMRVLVCTCRYFTKTVTSYLPLALPAQVTDVFTQGRAFALAALPVIGLRHTCVITTIQRSLK